MRSYETGKYAITKDGNFQLTLARVMASNFSDITICIPEEVSDQKAFMKMFVDGYTYSHHLTKKTKIKFQPLKYGVNAVETRQQFWKMNQEFFYSESILDYDLVITDITGYSGAMSYDLPFINNFNITKLPELDRPYIDQFFDLDLESIEKSLFTTVINPRQKEYIVEVAPHLADKVKVLTKVVSRVMTPRQVKMSRSTYPGIDTNTVFWPFRISDKSYRFEEFLEHFAPLALSHSANIRLVVTDPNDTLKQETLDKYPFIVKMKPSKEDYYKILEVNPIVVMLDDIDTVLHPGTIEFFEYGCPVITLASKLLPTSHEVASISEISTVIIDLLEYDTEYEISFELDDFVYDYNEICSLFNEDNINETN
jgi:hypothetical protein